ncbi:uracil-DNA glycosylase [Paenibacillus sp. WLX1005]|uniref:uracil-DNA glycosylase n=1 Tax=Paenibacillus sp. WLX1005 TaxID=3243766 RepID=UPI0039840DA6
MTEYRNSSHESTFRIGHVPLPPELIQSCLKRVEGLRMEGFLTGFGKWPGSLMLVGEAPGANEIEQGRPFCGQAGKVLDGYLDILQWTRDDLYITSAVRSRPYRDKPVKNHPERLSRSNRTPTTKEILAYAPILDYEIATVQPQVLITLGNIGLHRLIGNSSSVSQIHGQPRQTAIRQVDPYHPEQGYTWSERQYWIFPLYHPAAILYNRSLEQTIQDDLHRLRDFVKEVIKYKSEQ